MKAFNEVKQNLLSDKGQQLYRWYIKFQQAERIKSICHDLYRFRYDEHTNTIDKRMNKTWKIVDNFAPDFIKNDIWIGNTDKYLSNKATHYLVGIKILLLTDSDIKKVFCS